MYIVHVCVYDMCVCVCEYMYMCVCMCVCQALTVLLALTLARDEVLWLMKHILTPPPKGKHRSNPDDYVDTALPELLFFIVEVKGECLFMPVPPSLDDLPSFLLFSPSPLHSLPPLPSSVTPSLLHSPLPPSLRLPFFPPYHLTSLPPLLFQLFCANTRLLFRITTCAISEAMMLSS